MSLLGAVAGPTAKIVVGSGANIKTFHVHKQLLCDSSTYFKAALNNGFAETGNQTVELDDEDPDILLTYVLWLYEGKLNKETLPSDTINGAVQTYLLKLYGFADKRGIGNLANDTITMLTSYWTREPVDFSEVRLAVSLVSRNSKLYDLILDTLVLELRGWEIDFGRLTDADLFKEFLIDLLRRCNELCESFEGYDGCLKAVCHYHCHEGQSIMSEGECIENTEAGHNIYHEHNNLKQKPWEGKG